MRLASLTLTSFRNHAKTQCSFAQPLTIFVGSNAAGKTSMLEAIRCLSLAKSFRATTDRDVIRHDDVFCRVEADFIRADEDRMMTFFSEKSEASERATRKRITIDGVRQPMKQLLGALPTVLFTPEDLSLISDAPSDRRKYLDTLLCQTSPEYYASLVALKNVLRQRNSLLVRIRDGEASSDELDIWDAPFAMHSKTILDARSDLIEKFNEILPDAYSAIAGSEAIFALEQLQTLEGDDPTDELAVHREADLRAGRTLRGPHRDDVVFLLKDLPLASFGSRGELRSGILALKIAELDILEDAFSERPLLLLDDIFSELDQERQNALLELVRRQQTFITTTDLAHLHPETFFDASIMHVHQGSLADSSPACDLPEGKAHEQAESETSGNQLEQKGPQPPAQTMSAESPSAPTDEKIPTPA